jgi:hypothetical protein
LHRRQRQAEQEPPTVRGRTVLFDHGADGGNADAEQTPRRRQLDAIALLSHRHDVQPAAEPQVVDLATVGVPSSPERRRRWRQRFPLKGTGET